MKQNNILFFGKENDFFVEMAVDFIKRNFFSYEVYIGNRKQPFPIINKNKKYTYIISYLSPWIIPKALLKNTTNAAINFHPGPPEYPGIGCTNFALYEGSKNYGITCHYMNSKVDSGNIIFVERFPLRQTESVYTLTMRCYIEISHLFFKIMDLILNNQPLPSSKENWTKKPSTRKELDALCILTSDMSKSEIDLRIKSTSFPGMPGAYFKDK